ncbi:MAG: hypothetical protein JWM74_698, partial [Myxococcaceae bacterium]|nr:hypothetical protein [Myxococcaceae bacterium]
MIKNAALTVFAFMFSLAVGRDAAAFSYGSAVSSPCHEQITSAALRRIRVDMPGVRPLDATADETALIDDLPFDVDPDMSDLGGAALLVGVRDNDLKGRGGTEIDQLATIHGDPAFQREHCLRDPSEDEPNGSESALADCRAFIKEKVLDALDGLDAASAVDPSRRADINVALSLRGGVTAPLPRFYVRIGQAMHALQDSFTHTFRTSDGMRVRVVLNWIEFVSKKEVESRDGPIHKTELDRCDDPDPLRTRNKKLATDASVDLLHAALDPKLDRAAKEQAVDAVLVKYLSYEAGCTAENKWCDAPENAYPEPGSCGCSVVGNRASGWALVAAAAVLGLSIARRRTRRGVPRAMSVVLAFALVFPSVARAENAPAAPTAAPAAPAAPATPAAPAAETKAAEAAIVPETLPVAQPNLPRAPATREEAKEVKKEAVHSSPFALYGAGSGSFLDPALAAMLGVRYRLSDAWVVGLDGEINWWYGVHTQRLQLGATNLAATLIVRFPMRFEAVNLRSSLQLGTSIGLIDLYGVPKGSVGIFAAINPLG